MGRQLGKGPDGQPDVLFALKPVDGEQDLAAVVREKLGLVVIADSQPFLALLRDVDARIDDTGLATDPGEGGRKHRPGEAGVHGDRVGQPGRAGLEPVEGDTVERPHERLARGEQVVGEVAVEQHRHVRRKQPEQREARRQLVEEEAVIVGQLARREQRQRQM